MKITRILRRPAALIGAAVLLLASLLTALSSFVPASASQLTNRSITISSSKISNASTTYSVSFKAVSATTIKGIVVEFCQNSPLIGLACTTTNGVTNSPTSSTITVSNTAGTPASASYTVDANSTATGRLILTSASGIAPSLANPLTFNFTETNPSALGSFYARILTYDVVANAQAYVSATPGTHLDDGGVALSTANQLTINARVQENLTFCVGTTSIDNATSSIAANCGSVSGTTVDIGPIGTSTSVSPISVASGGNNTNGVAMVQTNAANGVTVSYYAEQGAGTNHKGALRVSGATCTADGVPSTSNVDQCFNSIGTTQATIAAATERFGVTIGGVNCASPTAYSCTYTSANENLKPTAQYYGQGNSGSPVYGTSNGFAWDETGTAQTIASSTTVVDNEALVLKFAAQALITTPTGSYGVTSTYVATSTF